MCGPGNVLMRSGPSKMPRMLVDEVMVVPLLLIWAIVLVVLIAVVGGLFYGWSRWMSRPGAPED
jgi:hypothetical protein